MKITNEEYSELIRQSERIEVLKDFIAEEDYVSSKAIKVILGISTNNKEVE